MKISDSLQRLSKAVKKLTDETKKRKKVKRKAPASKLPTEGY